jgi:hypothetical protein
MKSFIFATLLLISISMVAQKNVSINHSINDDGKKLDIKIKGTVNGKPVDYDRSFDVNGMNKEEKDAIKRNIYDSLGLPDPTVAPAPLSAMAPLTTFSAPGADGGPRIVSKDQYSEFYTEGGKHPYTKEIRYNVKTGLLFMKYRFQKNGKSVTSEKSVNARDKSKEEREQIIKAYENDIGFKEQVTT